MIKCKEDLYGTYVLLCDKEAAETYVKLINKFGISEIELGCNDRNENAIEVHKAEWTESGWDASYTKDSKNGLDAGSKRLTLSDLKPRTRTEYEKVKESIWELRGEFERGELVSKVGEQVTEIESEKHFVTQYSFGYIHRKVEKEIDWREDADSYFLKTKYLGIDCTIEEAITRSDYCDEFLELCRVALRANGEIE